MAGIDVVRDGDGHFRVLEDNSYPDAAGAPGEAVTGQSHAWIELWLGEWEAVDVTSGDPVGERHVLVARGRDYSDVPPLKGVYQGGASHSIGVTVTLTRLA